MKTKYTLTIDYTTGNSFGSEDNYDSETNLVFDNAQLAADAAELIQEHYKFYREWDKKSYSTTNQKKLLDTCIKSEWYQNYIKAGGKREYEHEWCVVSTGIGVETSPGVFKIVYPVWIGYFESLNNVNIRAVKCYLTPTIKNSIIEILCQH